jgi:hypothetical protein
MPDGLKVIGALMEFTKHGSRGLGESIVHANAGVREQFHEQALILDRQSRTANLDIP